jgi:hypothetical protein
MTEPSGTPHEPAAAPRRQPAPGARGRRRASFRITILGTLAGFLIVFELLAHQLRSGNDPAIGAGQVSAQVSQSGAGASSGSMSHGAVVTRASGAPAASTPAAQQPAVSTPAARQPMGATPAGRRSSHAVATRSSGGARATGHQGSRDDANEHEGSA